MLRILGAGAALTFLTVAAGSGSTPREVPASTAVADFVRGDVMILSSPNGRDVIVALDAGTPDRDLRPRLPASAQRQAGCLALPPGRGGEAA